MHSVRKVAGALLGIGTLVAAGVVGAPSASASTGLLKNYIINKCATPSGGHTANYTQVTLWTCNGSSSQNWETAATNNGLEIVNSDSGRCLTPYGGGGANGTNLVLFDCNGSPGQIWGLWYEQVGGQVVTILENGYAKPITAYSGSTADGTFLTEYTFNNDPTQNWKLP